MLLSANIFQPLINLLADVLKFFHGTVGLSWGLAIVALTVCLRLALVPLALKQFHSMQRMQQHMPEMKAIRAKYKDNPQRMQQETMNFYKENDINPFASCLPMLIQYPFLIAMFWMLRGTLRGDMCPSVQTAFQHTYASQHHVTLAKAAGQTAACNSNGAHTGGAAFLFIHDLTNSPHGVEMVVLLVLYIATSLGTSLIMMAPGIEKNQRYMMMGLPVIFAFVVINFPAGALLYYIIFNLWMIAQQGVFKEIVGHRYKPVDVAVAGGNGTAAVSAGGGAKAGKSSPSMFSRLAERASAAAEEAKQSDANAGKTNGGSKAKTPASTGAGKSGASKSKGPTAGTQAAGTAAAPESAKKSAPPPPPRKKKKRSGRRR
ncbi:MAG: membrane protein insertase YidC [Solirubrobacterales bacterium]|nr:membrane protein insertase YidC [Solirubrobacterales bacterium]